MSREAKGIARYNQDIQEMDGYIYTGKKTRKSSELFNKRASQAMNRIFDFKDKKVLDVGCGDGTYSVELLTRFGAHTVVGVEPSDAWKIGADKFSAHAPAVTIKQGNATHLEFPDDAFDVAVMRGVLHHLDEPLRGLKEMFRVAQHIFLLEPNGYNPLLKLIEVASPYHRAHAEKSYTPQTLRKMGQLSGGRFLRHGYFSLVPLLCPDGLAVFLDYLTPFWEKLPVLSKLGCGLYCVVFQKGPS